MKYFVVYGVIGIFVFGLSSALITPHNNPVAVPTPAPRNTLPQDLDEILRLIPKKPIQQLIIRYLLNDAQFQSLVRLINSRDGYVTLMRFRTQPEVLQLTNWLRTQLLLSGGDFLSDESNESLKIINRTPFWSQNVYGWQGFVNEFLLYYPEDLIRSHIQLKVAQNGVFAELVQRVKALKPVYERIIALPETQRLIAALEQNGINTADIDTFIRNQFGWQQNEGIAAGPGPQKLQG
ncbi:protein G12-like [Cochliomyia hominivorax]